jgi:alkyl hydroperoxide reductase subunit AhpC
MVVMKTRKTLWNTASGPICRGLGIIVTLSVAVAVIPAGGHALPEIAPDFTAGECIKADTLVLSQFFESPVVLFFFDAGDADCFKAYPYTANWHAKYAADGVSVIGIHCPGYEASKAWANVITAVARTILTFPIALDYDLEIYRDYEIERVPTLLLLEPGGRIVAQASAETDYHDFENEIHRVLRAIEPDVVLPFLFDRDKGRTKAGKFPAPTPKINLGYRSGAIVNCDSSDVGEFRRYTDPGGKERGGVYLEGRWKVEEGLITYEEGEAAHIRVIYSGKAVWLLPSFALDQNVRVYIEQDRSHLRLDIMGRDIKTDIETRSFLNMRYAIPLHVLTNAAYGTHELKIIPAEGVVSFEYLFFEGAR